MSSEAQIAANQQNAQHSTGPLTAEGKSASAKNSFRHGLTASAMSMLPGENVQDFIDLGNSLRAEHNPATVTEDALVTKMIESLWLSARAVKLQQRVTFEPQFNRENFDSYMRYQRMHDRAFRNAFDDLIKLRKEARQSEIGFVLQQQKQEQHVAKIRVLTARAEAHETTTQLRKARTAPAAPVSPAASPLSGTAAATGTQQTA